MKYLSLLSLFILSCLGVQAQNVGIGTTNPNTSLQVTGTSSSTDLLDVQDESGDSKLYIQNNGNIGIGQNSPGAKLHIDGFTTTGNPDIIIDNSVATIQLGPGTAGPHGFSFGDDGSEGLQLVYRSSPNQLIIEKDNDFNDNVDLFYVDYDTENAYFKGNVGMGTTSPVSELHVSGDVYFAGNALISAGGNPGNAGNNVDHIWHDDGSAGSGIGGTWHFVSDGTYKSTGNAMVKAQSFDGWGIVPVGSIIAWHKSLAGVPSLPDGWVECSGGTISDGNSPMNGQSIPNLNGGTTSSSGDASYGRFLRGHTSSGVFQSDVSNSIYRIEEDDSDGGSRGPVTIDDDGNWSSWIKDYNSDDRMRIQKRGVETRVTNMTVVWIMRIK